MLSQTYLPTDHFLTIFSRSTVNIFPPNTPNAMILEYKPKKFGSPKTFQLDWRQEPRHLTLRRCIYCGSTKQLTDEHTFPSAVWGRDKLLKGSCKKCAKETQKIEQHLYRDVLKKPREIMGAPTRKARSDGRWTGQSALRSDTGDLVLAPTAFTLPMLVLPYADFFPRAITGEAREEKHSRRLISITDPVGNHDPNLVNLISSVRFVPRIVERAIAKIAYCEYIRNFDHHFYSESLTRFIVSDEGDASCFVGAKIGEAKTGSLHMCGFKFLRNRSVARRGYSVLGGVRLFSFLDTPMYWIWLGDVYEPVEGVTTLEHWTY